MVPDDAAFSAVHHSRLPDTKVIYRRYASLFFITSISPGDNELITLEVIHRYVEVLDRYFGNVRDARASYFCTRVPC